MSTLTATSSDHVRRSPTTPHSFLACCALLGTFVIESHCGANRVDHADQAIRYLEQKLYTRALREARRAARQNGDESRPHLIAALAQLGLEQMDGSLASMRTAILIEPDNPRLYATLRDFCVQEGRYDLARDSFRALMEDMPENWQPQASLAWAHMRLDEDELALPLLKQALDTEDQEEEPRLFARVQLGRIYMRGERFEEAAQVLQRALDFDSNNARLGVALGECYLLQGQTEAAAESFDRALSKTEDILSTAVGIARTYYNADNRPRAIAYYERAMQVDNPPPLLLNNLAWTYAEEGIELDRAEELSREAVKIDADNVVYLDTHSEVLYLKGDYRRAIALMALAIDIEPEDGEQYEYLQEQMKKFRAAADL